MRTLSLMRNLLAASLIFAVIAPIDSAGPAAQAAGWIADAPRAVRDARTADEHFFAQAPAPASKRGLLAPEEVVLYIHAQLRNTQFIDPLICALERVLTAPVRVKRIDLPLGPELLASSTQFDAGKIADRFMRATAADGGPRTFKYLLIDHDMKVPELRYVFATSFGDQSTPHHVGIVSTARLEASGTGRTGGETTALRVYKLILKSVARVAGYTEPQGCILSFPRNLPELDQKSFQFCEQDRRALVNAGILRADERASCAPVAMNPPLRREPGAG